MIVAILGCTASGKSELAVDLAERLGGELLCVDSTTVYRELNIGTAKPTAPERLRVPHHLLDLVSLTEEFSFARFQRLALDTLREVLGRGRLPILVGGTHLYLKGLLEGYQLTDVPPDPEFRAWAETQPLDELVAQLGQVDPDSLAIVDLKNPRRVVRALEVCRQVKFSLNYRRNPLPYKVLRIGLSIAKDELEPRVEQRIEKMFLCGWVEEVQELAKKCLAEPLKKLHIIGYSEILEVLEGLSTWTDAREKIKRATLQLARKQGVWYRREKEVQWLRFDDEQRYAKAEQLARSQGC
jgi:tRNA dimethylallyltransferase